jgi:hypothetical protein
MQQPTAEDAAPSPTLFRGLPELPAPFRGIPERGRSPRQITGPTASRGARLTGSGAELIADRIGQALANVNDWGVRYRVQKELEARMPKIEEYQRTHPGEGVLVVVTLEISTRVTDPGLPGPLPSFLTMNLNYGGQKKEEAIARDRRELHWRQVAGPNYRNWDEYIWIPPSSIKPEEGIAGLYRSSDMTLLLKITESATGTLQYEAWDPRDSEKYVTNPAEWQVDWSTRRATLKIDFTKRSTGWAIHSTLTYIGQGRLHESFEVRSHHNYGAHGERLLERSSF